MSQPLPKTAVAHEEVAPKEESLLASFGINGQMFLFQLFNFALVLAIVWFLILKPLTKKMEERKQLIDESLDRAKEIETAHVMSQQKYQEKIDEGKIESNRIIEAAHKEGERLGQQLKDKARGEIEMLVEQAKRNIEIDRQQMRTQIKQETVALVVAATEKIIGEKMTSKKDEAFVAEVIQSVSPSDHS